MKILFCISYTLIQLIFDINAIDVVTSLPEVVSKAIPAAIAEIGQNETRRILMGSVVECTRPYMVYLKMAPSSKKVKNYRKWLCGGVIIHEDHILTSAACIQDVENFYVVSGTYKYCDEFTRKNNLCYKNGAKKAIWKCVPKNYCFDGKENDNIRWMNNDIAVVKTEDSFDFTRRIRGCDFIPKPICYNNQSESLECEGTKATIAGWGTTEKYNDWVNTRRLENQRDLLEAKVEIMQKSKCKRRWGARYHNIIDNYMICTNVEDRMSDICTEKYVECTDVDYSGEDDLRRTERIPVNLLAHSAYHNETYPNGTRRFNDDLKDGGFCENDHGGPLVYGTGENAVVLGIISACLVKEKSNKCYGPFLYTSVYKNRQLISCAINKDVEPNCRRQFRSGVTHDEQFFNWDSHPDGPAKRIQRSYEDPEPIARAAPEVSVPAAPAGAPAPVPAVAAPAPAVVAPAPAAPAANAPTPAPKAPAAGV